MELALGAPVAGVLALLGGALALGLRQGLDWHHVVAISDITGAAAAVPGAPTVADRRDVGLAVLYAVGHACVVALLGVVALSLRASLPDWLEPVAQRAVGLLLLVLGLGVVYALVRAWHRGEEVRLVNRWAMVAGVARRIGRLGRSLGARRTCRDPEAAPPSGRRDRLPLYGPRAAFGVGIIHGVGAETAPALLMIATVGGAGAASAGLGVGMLLAFLAGLLLSNVGLVLVTALGFRSAGRARGAYLVLGGLAAAVSVYVGTCALLGVSDGLPELFALPPPLPGVVAGADGVARA